MTISALKAALRTDVRARRRQRSESRRRAAAESIARQGVAMLESLPLAGPARLTGYLSLSTEPGTDALLSAACAAGHAVWVPRIDGHHLRWVAHHPGDPVARGPLGIREPLGEAIDAQDLDALDVMLLPGLAVDRDGHRLGQGGGFYDRTLAQVPTHEEGGPLRVVVLFDDEVIEAVPIEPHDCVVDAALTETGVLHFR